MGIISMMTGRPIRSRSMSKSEIYTFDPNTLNDMSMTDIIGIVEGLIGIIMDQDKEIELLNAVIANIEDDGK